MFYRSCFLNVEHRFFSSACQLVVWRAKMLCSCALATAAGNWTCAERAFKMSNHINVCLIRYQSERALLSLAGTFRSGKIGKQVVVNAAAYACALGIWNTCEWYLTRSFCSATLVLIWRTVMFYSINMLAGTLFLSYAGAFGSQVSSGADKLENMWCSNPRGAQIRCIWSTNTC